MKTKIEIARDTQHQLNNSIKTVQKCLGNEWSEDKKRFTINPRNDKHHFGFSTTKHHSSAPIFLDAYYGYYGDSNVSFLNNDFYVDCLAKALNMMVPQIIEKTQEIMENTYKEALLEAKDEAKHILRLCNELENKDDETKGEV